MNREKAEREKLVHQVEFQRRLSQLDADVGRGLITYSQAITYAFGCGIEFADALRRVDEERE